jgi:hypothetical protein
MKKGTLVIGAALLVALLYGCASAPATTPTAPVQKSVALDWKGASLGAAVPDWVEKALQSNARIQTLPEYSGYYCFAISRDDPTSKDFATAWVDNAANGAQEVGRIVSTTVNARAETELTGSTGQAATEETPAVAAGTSAKLAEYREAMNNAAYTGLRKEADFWVQTKNNETGQTYYTAYALWIIDQTNLDTQVAANLQQMMDRNAVMSDAEKAIYADIIGELRTKTGALMGG